MSKTISIQNTSHPAGLYITATPIGNLGDVTLRALDVLRQAELILAEDTRRTRKLLTHYEIQPKNLQPFHDYRPLRPALMEKIRAVIKTSGLVALASDAGTPLISDPGFDLVRAMRAEALPVFALPGASSVVAALSIAAIPCHRWCFGGFLPPKQGARMKYLKSFDAQGGALVFFETAPRLLKALGDMIVLFGENCPAAIARELTKKFEELNHGTLQSLLEFYQAKPPKGEIVILLAPNGQA